MISSDQKCQLEIAEWKIINKIRSFSPKFKITIKYTDELRTFFLFKWVDKLNKILIRLYYNNVQL